jgi:hypothetical protein
VSLSALCARCPFSPRKIPGAHISVKGCRHKGQGAAGRIAQAEKSNGLTGNRARDLSACSRLVPQPTMLPRAPVNIPLKEGIGQFLMVFLADS